VVLSNEANEPPTTVLIWSASAWPFLYVPARSTAVPFAPTLMLKSPAASVSVLYSAFTPEVLAVPEAPTEPNAAVSVVVVVAIVPVVVARATLIPRVTAAVPPIVTWFVVSVLVNTRRPAPLTVAKVAGVPPYAGVAALPIAVLIAVARAVTLA